MEADLLARTFRLEKFDGIFMTVRHPIRRIFSEYRMRLDPEAPEDFNEWFARIYDEYQEDPYVSDNHIRPQHEFYIKGCSVFRQEDGFDAEWARKCQKIFGIKFARMVKGRAESSHKKLAFATGTDDVSSENKKKILELYAKDFDQFGYEPVFE
jgi:hypothetical protein